MRRKEIVVLCLALFPVLNVSDSRAWTGSEGKASSFTPDGRMLYPVDFREWIFLSSDLDMSYTPAGQAGMQMDSAFGNVFVNPAAYRAFKTTGTWPNGTVMVLEHRVASGNASINRAGHFQGAAHPEIEVHVKDSRFPGNWAFFAFPDGQPAQPVKRSASCYSCHQEHGAVDTTFVQFYPTLTEIAKAKGTFHER